MNEIGGDTKLSQILLLRNNKKHLGCLEKIEIKSFRIQGTTAFDLIGNYEDWIDSGIFQEDATSVLKGNFVVP